jgi:choline transporter-like protein 2/4/5
MLDTDTYTQGDSKVSSPLFIVLFVVVFAYVIAGIFMVGKSAPHSVRRRLFV